MKKAIAIIVFGLLWFNSNAIAEEHKFKSKDIKGFKKIRISMHNKKVNRIKQVKKSDGFPVYEGDTSIQFTVNREDAGCGDGTSKDLECDGKGNRSRQELIFDREKKLNNKEIGNKTNNKIINSNKSSFRFGEEFLVKKYLFMIVWRNTCL